MSKFIERKFYDTKNSTIVAFDKLLQNNISVILGEPASGKTEQLKQFQQENTEDVCFVELINIESENNLQDIQDKKYVLLDSIDEALVDYANDKKLQKQLTDFIKDCKAQNSNIKFVITSRQLEWNDYFKNELEQLDKKLVVYQIQDLTEDQINQILIQKKIDTKEFWQFISKNYLNSLLKNILVVQYLIDHYHEFKTKELSFIDIYFDLIKEHLSVKGDDRKTHTSKPLTKLVDITSSLASYMLLNRKPSISFNNPSKLADELYAVDNQAIKTDELDVILNTSLFKKNGESFSFFHKSVQEFLMAHFINEKKLDIKTIKKLFSHELRFYEEFEEVIVYLTNLNNDLFDQFVHFDPFIFKRHPNLTKEQQEKLLHSLLNKLKNEQSLVWDRWQDFKDTTLVEFKKLDNLASLVRNNIESSQINSVTFPYLMALLQHNYSYEIEDLIFEYLKEFSINNPSEKKEEYDEITDSKYEGSKKLRELIENDFIDNFAFNKRLYSFLRDKKLINSNTDKISVIDFETLLFESLYGIKYKNRYDDKQIVDFIDTGFEFDKLLELLDAIPTDQLKYIVPYIKPEDSLKWLEHIKSKEEKEAYHINCWCAYTVLLHNSSKEAIKKVFEFLSTHFCHMFNQKFDEIPLDFKRIADNFWDVYFTLEFNPLFHSNDLLKELQISLDDIKKATSKYPIEKYIEHYKMLRFNQDIEKYLMQNDTFQDHMIELKKYWDEEREKHEKEFQKRLSKDESYKKSIQQKENLKKICEESLKALATKQDFYNVFFCEEIYEEENQHKLHNLFTNEQYKRLLNFIEDDFKYDEVYIQIKNELFLNHNKYKQSALFIYLFKNSDSSKIINLVQNQDDFQKIFFHTFRFQKIKEEYFVSLVSKYFDYFISSTQELIKLSLEQTENKDLVYMYELREVIEQLGKFDKDNLSVLVHYLRSLDKDIFKSIKEEHKIKEVLKIISLDEQSYEFIDALKDIDNDRAYAYLKYLLQIDAKRTLDTFFAQYQKEPSKIKFYKLKIYFYTKKKSNDTLGKYDKLCMNPKKIKLFKDLMIALKKSKTIDALEDRYIFTIISDYHQLFTEYERPTGSYTPDVYHEMNQYINYIWSSMGADTSRIKLLKELSKNKCKSLSDTAKYYLQQAYDNQNKNRSHTNSYYKNILDKGDLMDNSNYAKIKKKWEELTMYQKITITIAVIGGIIMPIWLNSSSANIKINNNNQSPMIQKNHGNIIYNIDNSKNQSIHNNVQISNKINNLINTTTVNIKGENQEEQKDINTKIYILNEAKKINKKNMSIADKNKECKDQAVNATNLLEYNLDIMNQVCDEIFLSKLKDN